MRYFHSKMFPNKRLRCRSYDQKPLYFNQAGDKGSFACRDDPEVTVREIDSASRARFTAMIKNVDKDPDESMEEVAARSHGSGNPMRLGVLFKTKGKERKLERISLFPLMFCFSLHPRGLTEWKMWLNF